VPQPTVLQNTKNVYYTFNSLKFPAEMEAEKHQQLLCIVSL